MIDDEAREAILTTSFETLQRLDAIEPREPHIHIPDGLEKWKADGEAAERRRRRAAREMQREQRAARAAQAQQGQDNAAGWEAWLQRRLVEERRHTIDILDET